MKPAFIYAILAGSAVKIGYTARPRNRIKVLRSSLPVRVRAAACVEVAEAGKLIIEAELHRRFRHRALRGEWFNIDMKDARAALARYGEVHNPLTPDWRDPMTASPEAAARTPTWLSPADRHESMRAVIEQIKRDRVPFTEIRWKRGFKRIRRTARWNWDRLRELEQGEAA